MFFLPPMTGPCNACQLLVHQRRTGAHIAGVPGYPAPFLACRKFNAPSEWQAWDSLVTRTTLPGEERKAL